MSWWVCPDGARELIYNYPLLLGSRRRLLLLAPLAEQSKYHDQRAFIQTRVNESISNVRSFIGPRRYIAELLRNNASPGMTTEIELLKCCKNMQCFIETLLSIHCVYYRYISCSLCVTVRGHLNIYKVLTHKWHTVTCEGLRGCDCDHYKSIHIRTFK